MEYLIGFGLALAVCLFAARVGLDRDRVLYPTLGSTPCHHRAGQTLENKLAFGGLAFGFGGIRVLDLRTHVQAKLQRDRVNPYRFPSREKADELPSYTN